MDTLRTEISANILAMAGGLIFAIAAAIDVIVHSVSL
jgi:hypothetical protein